MTTIESTTNVNEINTYVERVAQLLDAIPDDERAELLDDLRSHLREVSSENPDTTLDECIGTPEAYALELLASAGVPTTVPRAKRRSWVTKRYNAASDSFNSTSIGRIVNEYGTILAPAWWVARAYLVVSLIAAIGLNGNAYGSIPVMINPQYPGFPLPELFGSSAIGVLAIVLLVPVSVALGRGSLSGFAKFSLVAVNCALAVYAFVLLDRGTSPQTIVNYVATDSYQQDACLKNGANMRVTNVYPYDTSGKLLDNILLFDQTGQPINNLCPEFDNQGRPLSNAYGQDANGAPVYGLFPRQQTVQEYINDGSGKLSDPKPVRPPAVVIPQVVPGVSVTTTTTTTPAFQVLPAGTPTTIGAN